MRIVTQFETGDIFSAPEWTPDGASLLIAALEGDGRSVIRKVDIATGTGTVVTTSGDAYHPRLSPSGHHLLVTLWNTRVRVWRAF